MPLRAVFLDVGNTLLREVVPRFELYARAARRRGREVSAEEMRRRMGAAHRALPLWIGGGFRYSDPWFEAFIARIFGPPDPSRGPVVEGVGAEGLGFGAAEVAAITAELFETFESADTFRPFPGCRELLEDLRERGLVLATISNWSERLPRVLASLELLEAFDFVLASAVEGLEKPDPALFRRALERAGAKPDEALHAGDHPVLDAAAARAVGMEAVLVRHADDPGLVPAPGAESSGDGIVRVGSLPELGTLVARRSR